MVSSPRLIVDWLGPNRLLLFLARLSLASSVVAVAIVSAGGAPIGVGLVGVGLLSLGCACARSAFVDWSARRGFLQLVGGELRFDGKVIASVDTIEFVDVVERDRRSILVLGRKWRAPLAFAGEVGDLAARLKELGCGTELHPLAIGALTRIERTSEDDDVSPMWKRVLRLALGIVLFLLLAGPILSLGGIGAGLEGIGKVVTFVIGGVARAFGVMGWRRGGPRVVVGADGVVLVEGRGRERFIHIREVWALDVTEKGLSFRFESGGTVFVRDDDMSTFGPVRLLGDRILDAMLIDSPEAPATAPSTYRREPPVSSAWRVVHNRFEDSVRRADAALDLAWSEEVRAAFGAVAASTAHPVLRAILTDLARGDVESARARRRSCNGRLELRGAS